MPKNEPLCPICLSDSRFWDKSVNIAPKNNGKTKKEEFLIYKCNSCGHGFLHPGLQNKEELQKYYNEDYATSYNPDIEDESFKLRKEQYKLDVNLIKSYVSIDKISVLDYGCSMGMFLNAMPSEWKKYGYEINKFELEYIAKNFKEIRTFSDVSQIRKNNFDLITLRGVIEHLFDFNDLFSILIDSLKDKGLVYVCATPDFNSPCACVYKSYWNQIGPPLHYHQFTAASITILFGNKGFGLRNLTYPYENTPYSDFPRDGIKFINNVRRIIENDKPVETQHAYPGTMMSLVFEKVK